MRTLLNGIVRSLLGLFEEKLPVSRVHGKGKFATEVVTKGHYQAELERLCGGRSVKPHKHQTIAVVAPGKDGSMRVVVHDIQVGELSIKDARTLAAQMAKTSSEPFALSVAAKIDGGTRPKKGKGKGLPFVVRLDLPTPPEKPKPKEKTGAGPKPEKKTVDAKPPERPKKGKAPLEKPVPLLLKPEPKRRRKPRNVDWEEASAGPVVGPETLERE